MTQDIRYFYLRDPKNQKRSMCVARKLFKDEDVVHFQFSCNHPTVKVEGTVLDKGDVYSKKKGRMIAVGRLEKDPYILPLEGRFPFRSILEALATYSQEDLNDLRLEENVRCEEWEAEDGSPVLIRIDRPIPTALRKAAKEMLKGLKEDK